MCDEPRIRCAAIRMGGVVMSLVATVLVAMALGFPAPARAAAPESRPVGMAADLPAGMADTPAGALGAGPTAVSAPLPSFRLRADSATPLTRFTVRWDRVNGPAPAAQADPMAVLKPGRGRPLRRLAWRIIDLDLSGPGRQVLRRETGVVPVLYVPAGALRPGRRYQVQVRGGDGDGHWGRPAHAHVLATVARDPADRDGNGIADRAHVAGWAMARESPPISSMPSGTISSGTGPARATGMRAPGPPHTVVVADAVARERVTLSVSGGTITHTATLGRAHLRHAVRPVHSLPFGLFSVRIDGISPGASVDLTHHLPQAAPGGASWHWFDPVRGLLAIADGAVAVDHNRARVTLVDGGHGDLDGVANGVILDCGGLAVSRRGSTAHRGPLQLPRF